MCSNAVWTVCSCCPVVSKRVDCSTAADTQQRSSCCEKHYVYVGRCMYCRLLIGEGGCRAVRRRQGRGHQYHQLSTLTTAGALCKVRSRPTSRLICLAIQHSTKYSEKSKLSCLLKNGILEGAWVARCQRFDERETLQSTASWNVLTSNSASSLVQRGRWNSVCSYYEQCHVSFILRWTSTAAVDQSLFWWCRPACVLLLSMCVCHMRYNSGPCSDVYHLCHSKNHWTELNWTELNRLRADT